MVEAGLTKDAERWLRCGNESVLYCGACEKPRKLKERCERQICPECARSHAAQLRAAWEKAACGFPNAHGYRWRMITLTVKVTGDLAFDYARILDGASKLFGRWRRRFPDWGGFRCVEVGAGGNVHMHILAYVGYVLQKQLSIEWLALTGDSKIVHVCEVKGGIHGGLREVLKYITKIKGARPEDLVPLYVAWKGKQRSRACGAMHGEVEKVIPEPFHCKHCGCTEFTQSPHTDGAASVAAAVAGMLTARPPPNPEADQWLS